jgi:hypothetical protein
VEVEVVYKQQDWAPADVADGRVDVADGRVDVADGHVDVAVVAVEHVDKAEQVLGQLVVDLVGELPMGR